MLIIKIIYNSSKLFLEDLAATAACPSSRLLAQYAANFSFCNSGRPDQLKIADTTYDIQARHLTFMRNTDHHACFFSQRASASFLVTGQGYYDSCPRYAISQ